jgi:hypothetical protein
MEIETLLANPDMLLGYPEPVPALGPDGQVYTATRFVRVSVKDAIAVQRHAHRGLAAYPDRKALLDFLAVHWASPTN